MSRHIGYLLVALTTVLYLSAIPWSAADVPAINDAPSDERALGVALYDPMEPAGGQIPVSRVMVPARPGSGLEFVPGKFGRCAHFLPGGKASLKYPAAIIPFDEGTLEFWLCFDQAPSTFEKACTIFQYHAGKNWYSNYFSLFHGGRQGWGSKLFFMICDGQEKRSSAIATTTDWKAGQWHHIAVTWKLNAPGASSLAVYVDRQSVQQDTGLTIMQDKQTMAAFKDDLNFGFLWLGPGSAREVGFKIDELRLYPFRRQYLQG